MKKLSHGVAEFKRDICGATLPTRPVKSLDPKWIDDTKVCLSEEYKELCEAMDNDDVVETADALADLIYFAMGQALLAGINIDRVLSEVHRSNMTKKRGVKEGRELSNDVIKDKTYSPPNIKKVM